MAREDCCRREARKCMRCNGTGRVAFDDWFGNAANATALCDHCLGEKECPEWRARKIQHTF